MTPTDPAPTADVELLRQRHQELLKNTLSNAVAPEQCRQFVDELIDAGRDVSSGRDREALRKMLYYWSAEAVGRGILRRGEPLPTLAPFRGVESPQDEPSAPTKSSATIAIEDSEAATDARAAIRIAALARQWHVAGRTAGYLLTGAALEEAKKYEDTDFEIRAFVEASKASAARIKSQRWQSSFVALLMLTLILGGGLWYVVKLNDDLQVANADLATESAKVKLARDAVEAARGRENQQTREEARRAVEAMNAGGADPLRQLKALLQRLGDAQPDELSRLQVGPAISPAGATALENRIAPADVEQRAIAPSQDSTCKGTLWLGNDSDRLITNSGPLSDLQSGGTITVRTGSSVRLRKGMPLPGYVMAPQIGVVPGGASLILTGSPQMHRSPNPSALDQYFAPVTAPQQYCTRVFVQFAGDSALAQKARSHLLGMSFQVPPAQEINSAWKTAEVRVFWEQDLPMANLIASGLSEFNGDKPLQVRPLFGFPTKPAQGTLEVWMDFNR